MNCRGQGSHARGVYPTQIISIAHEKGKGETRGRSKEEEAKE